MPSSGGRLILLETASPPLLGTGQLEFLLWQARADSTKAQTELEVGFTPWRDGIRRTVEWMRSIGRI